MVRTSAELQVEVSSGNKQRRVKVALGTTGGAGARSIPMESATSTCRSAATARPGGVRPRPPRLWSTGLENGAGRAPPGPGTTATAPCPARATPRPRRPPPWPRLSVIGREDGSGCYRARGRRHPARAAPPSSGGGEPWPRRERPAAERRAREAVWAYDWRGGAVARERRRAKRRRVATATHSVRCVQARGERKERKEKKKKIVRPIG